MNNKTLFLLALCILMLMFLGFTLGIISTKKRIIEVANTNKSIYINGDNYLIYKEKK